MLGVQQTNLNPSKGAAGNPVPDARSIRTDYQLDFLIPGMFPARAFSRKQMRQMPNLRMYARRRPQMLHRLYALTANFGSRFCLAIHDLRATLPAS